MPNDDQETTATGTTGTTTISSTGTKLGAGGTPTIVYCTRNNKAQTIATAAHYLEEGLAREMNFTYHDLQHNSVHQL
jgi:hypothetical protein